MTVCCAISALTARVPVSRQTKATGLNQSRNPATSGAGIAGGRRIEQVGGDAYIGVMTQHALSFPQVALASLSLPRPSPTGLPDPETCWQAVQKRDRASNEIGRAH